MRTKRILQLLTINLLSLAGVIAGVVTWLLTQSTGWGTLGGVLFAIIGLTAGFILGKSWNVPMVVIRPIVAIFGGPIKEYPDDIWKSGGPQGPASYLGGPTPGV